jgi:hypothetical protein
MQKAKNRFNYSEHSSSLMKAVINPIEDLITASYPYLRNEMSKYLGDR